MILSEGRQSVLARLVIDGIWKEDLVDFSDDDKALRFAKKGIEKFVAEVQLVDQKTRQKIASLKRGVVEGSPEYDVLYGKYFEEEMKKSGNV